MVFAVELGSAFGSGSETHHPSHADRAEGFPSAVPVLRI